MEILVNSISLILGSLVAGFFLMAFVVSLTEREWRASLASLLIGLVLVAPVIITWILRDDIGSLPLLIITVIYLAVSILVFIPIRSRTPSYDDPVSRIDERNIMFSRKLLEPGSERFDKFYSNNPGLREADDKFRSKPGLLKKGSHYYNPVAFNAAEASFATVKSFHNLVEGKPSEERIPLEREEITLYLKQWARKLGAVSVGITEVKDYHWYSHIGRGEDFGKEVKLNHKYAIAFIVEMDKRMMDCAPMAPTVMESAQQYLEVGRIATQVAVFIREMGYEARAHIDGNYRVVCPLVAHDAGLGEIGRMGLLMTPVLGPRVRISVVTTDLELIPDKVARDTTMIDFCRLCKKCARICPSRAISFDDRIEIEGVKRWQINQEHCFTMWCIAGTDCGLCMKDCPYSHPDNILHRFIRFGIRNNPLFRRMAVHMDDLFYGRRPVSKEVPGWIPDKK